MINITSSIIPSPSLLSSRNTCILYTWAIDHMCHHAHMFHTLTTIPALAVKLRNGKTITTNQSSTIKFNDDFYLLDVLYIPWFAPISFLYIGQLIPLIVVLTLMPPLALYKGMLLWRWLVQLIFIKAYTTLAFPFCMLP